MVVVVVVVVVTVIMITYDNCRLDNPTSVHLARSSALHVAVAVVETSKT